MTFSRCWHRGKYEALAHKERTRSDARYARDAHYGGPTRPCRWKLGAHTQLHNSCTIWQLRTCTESCTEILQFGEFCTPALVSLFAFQIPAVFLTHPCPCSPFPVPFLLSGKL